MTLVYKYLLFPQMPQHKISNSVFCESSITGITGTNTITGITGEPRQLPVLSFKTTGSWKTKLLLQLTSAKIVYITYYHEERFLWIFQQYIPLM